MFLSSENYLDHLKQLIAGSQHLSIAVAFWGKGAEKLFENWQGKKLRIICNLESGATNPEVITAIREWKGKKVFEVEVRTLGDLHAKVVLGEHEAIMGSANISANGLGYEASECSGWQEAGLRVADQQVLKTARDWFEQQWQRAGQDLTDDQLDQARLAWEKHRASRPNPSNNANCLLDAPLEALLDRPIYLAIYRIQKVSDEAMACGAAAVEQARCSPELALNSRNLDFFEDWPDDSAEPLPKDAPIIRVYYGARGAVRVRGVWQRIPVLDQGYPNAEGMRVSVPILERRNKVLDWTLGSLEQKRLGERLQEWLTSLYPETDGEMDTGGCCRRLDEFLLWEAERDGMPL